MKWLGLSFNLNSCQTNSASLFGKQWQKKSCLLYFAVTKSFGKNQSFNLNYNVYLLLKLINFNTRWNWLSDEVVHLHVKYYFSEKPVHTIEIVRKIIPVAFLFFMTYPSIFPRYKWVYIPRWKCMRNSQSRCKSL